MDWREQNIIQMTHPHWSQPTTTSSQHSLATSVSSYLLLLCVFGLSSVLSRALSSYLTFSVLTIGEQSSTTPGKCSPFLPLFLLVTLPVITFCFTSSYIFYSNKGIASTIHHTGCFYLCMYICMFVFLLFTVKYTAHKEIMQNKSA